jgi:hypothetical protein
VGTALFGVGTGWHPLRALVTPRAHGTADGQGWEWAGVEVAAVVRRATCADDDGVR